MRTVHVFNRRTTTCTAMPNRAREIRLVREKMYIAIRQAYETCHKNKDLPECQVAWSDVEEISRALYRLKTAESKFNDYCNSNPGDPECRIYDV